MNVKIINCLRKQPRVGLRKLYKELDVSSKKDKQTVLHLLRQWQMKGFLTFDQSSGMIRVKDLSKISGQNEQNMGDTKSPIREKKPPLKLKEAIDDFALIVDRYELPKGFSKNALEEIQNKVWERQQDCNRKDFRDLFVITIDGADSKDLDDAVSIKEHLFGGWTLGVHIADVSYYVPKDSALDQEALRRANSYYLVNKVIPMLPQELSNDLCSLNPHEEKRTMSIFMRFDRKGNMLSYEITPSMIRSSYRMTYDRVEEIMATKIEKDKVLLKNIKIMEKLFRILNKKRIQDGSIEFNFRERKMKLNDLGIPTSIYQKDRLDSERLIEEFMLAANQATGSFLEKNGFGLFRVHDFPPEEKYLRFKKFAAKRGHKLPDRPKPIDIQRFLDVMIDSPLQMSAEILALRSMSQAVYQRENIGHFGLGFMLYAHFTSPIRRYADLVVHRLIKHFLFHKDKSLPYNEQTLDKIATHISALERTAMEAEREFYRIKAVRFMKPLEGGIFDGMISSVAAFGVFVEMKDTGIEAMVRYSDMSDFMEFDEDELHAKGKRSGKIYKIGDPARIQLSKVNTERGFIDAVFVE